MLRHIVETTGDHRMGVIIMNKMIKIVFFFMLSLFLACNLTAQVKVERSTEIVKISGKEYYMHHVKAGETLFSIAQAYQVTIEEIERLNPEVAEGLKAGQVIGIPVVEPQESLGHTAENEKTTLVLNGEYVVQAGENLYDIAKKFGIDVSEFKALNPGLTNEPNLGTVIKVPNIVNTDDYLVHKVEYNERTTSLLNRWKVSESEFRGINISVGSHVFVNQMVLIPIPREGRMSLSTETVAEEIVAEEINAEEDVDEGKPLSPLEGHEVVFAEEKDWEVPECNPSDDNASKHYKVALMVPLYLYDIGKLDVDKERVAQARKSRSLSFLQFYEGFMMAVESLTQDDGLHLDLMVLDVTDNESTAHDALSEIQNKDLDLIVGPFFSKSFEVVEAYAKEKGIIMINPLSTRESIIEGNPNVVKVKASAAGQIMDVYNIVKNYYQDANVFIVSQEKEEDADYLNVLEQQVIQAVKAEVPVSHEEILRYAREESKEREMGERLVSTVDVEGQVYSTEDLQSHPMDGVVLENPVKRYAYSDIGKMKSQLSGVRNNLVFAYGDSNVFATQVLNTLKKEVDMKPITLVALPDWTKFEKLLVDNLLDMNAIYFSDFFVDYRNPQVKQFVQRFRSKYKAEPQQYAFEGYDVAWYFLNALMRYGRDMAGCLPYFDLPLLHAQYHFKNMGQNNGIENQAWSVYQYDNEAIELVPVNPYNKVGDE